MSPVAGGLPNSELVNIGCPVRPPPWSAGRALTSFGSGRDSPFTNHQGVCVALRSKRNQHNLLGRISWVPDVCMRFLEPGAPGFLTPGP